MKALLCLLLMGSMIAQNLSELKSGGSHAPIVKKPLNLTIEDISTSDPYIKWWELRGRVHVNFLVDVNGKVVNPNIIDTFDVRLNEVILDKLKLIEYTPAIQNGIPIQVHMSLPILFN